jgi:hypothetical protein
METKGGKEKERGHAERKDWGLMRGRKSKEGEGKGRVRGMGRRRVRKGEVKGEEGGVEG